MTGIRRNDRVVSTFVSVRHFVEQLTGVLQAAQICIGFDGSVEEEGWGRGVRGRDYVGLDAAGLDEVLLGEAEVEEADIGGWGEGGGGGFEDGDGLGEVFGIDGGENGGFRGDWRGFSWGVLN